MLGAIIGDIVGSRFEFRNIKFKKFNLFSEKCFFTEDTVLTLAITNAFLECKKDFSNLTELTEKHLRKYGKAYKKAMDICLRSGLTKKIPSPITALSTVRQILLNILLLNMPMVEILKVWLLRVAGPEKRLLSIEYVEFLR